MTQAATPTSAPPADPVRAALDDPLVRTKLLTHARAVFRGRLADADDATQEVLRRAWERRHTFDPAAGSVGGWLFGFAANVFHEMFRAGNRRPAQQPADADRWAGAAVAPAGPAADAADDRVLAEYYLDRLPAELADAVRMRHLDGLEYPQIAACQKVSAACARKRVSRGLELLREWIGVAPGEERP